VAGGGVGPGPGVAVGAGVGTGVGAGVAPGMTGIAIVTTPLFEGVLLGWVGSSSVIVWHPSISAAATTVPRARVFMVTPRLEITSEGHT
jgi:hypothetical protein